MNNKAELVKLKHKWNTHNDQAAFLLFEYECKLSLVQVKIQELQTLCLKPSKRKTHLLNIQTKVTGLLHDVTIIQSMLDRVCGIVADMINLLVEFQTYHSANDNTNSVDFLAWVTDKISTAEDLQNRLKKDRDDLGAHYTSLKSLVI